jgi:hypothetical protein
MWADTEAGRAALEMMVARREWARSTSMAERAGWRDRRFYRKQASVWSEREAVALGLRVTHGASQAERLD